MMNKWILLIIIIYIKWIMRIIKSENKLLKCIFEYYKNNGRIKNGGLKYKFYKKLIDTTE